MFSVFNPSSAWIQSRISLMSSRDVVQLRSVAGLRQSLTDVSRREGHLKNSSLVVDHQLYSWLRPVHSTSPMLSTSVGAAEQSSSGATTRCQRFFTQEEIQELDNCSSIVDCQLCGCLSRRRESVSERNRKVFRDYPPTRQWRYGISLSST